MKKNVIKLNEEQLIGMIKNTLLEYRDSYKDGDLQYYTQDGHTAKSRDHALKTNPSNFFKSDNARYAAGIGKVGKRSKANATSKSGKDYVIHNGGNPYNHGKGAEIVKIQYLISDLKKSKINWEPDELEVLESIELKLYNLACDIKKKNTKRRSGIEE